jgi:transposase-like protein
LDYPANFLQMTDWFASEGDCWSYLARLRWPDGFSCPRCQHKDAWLTKRCLYVCTSCRKQTSVTAGTVFDHSRLTLRQWLLAVWFVSAEKRGVSAKSLQATLGLGSYETAWLALQKIRLAMGKTSSDLLDGVVEVDETFVGGVAAGKRGRGAAGKALVIVAAERRGVARVSQRVKIGRIRLRVIPDATRATLESFVTDVVKPAAVVHTDGFGSYANLENLGFEHLSTNVSASGAHAHLSLPAVHRVSSLLKRWLLGTHQGGLAYQHLDSYLDEYTFRFNRRNARNRGLVFYLLLQQCLRTRPQSYETLVLSRRSLRGKTRGPTPNPPGRTRLPAPFLSRPLPDLDDPDLPF